MDEIKKIKFSVILAGPGYFVYDDDPIIIDTYVVDANGSVKAKKEEKWKKGKRILKNSEMFKLGKRKISYFFKKIKNIADNANCHEVFHCDSGGTMKIFYELECHTEEFSLWTSIDENSQTLYFALYEFLLKNKIVKND